MYCPYCESAESGERAEGHTDALTICPNCGGEVPVEQHTSATQCPYCDSYLIFNDDSFSDGKGELQTVHSREVPKMSVCPHRFPLRGAAQQYAGNLCTLLVL